MSNVAKSADWWARIRVAAGLAFSRIGSRDAIQIFLWLVVAAILVRATWVASTWFLSKTASRDDPFLVGDWLINFEGGFVRRGIYGQILEGFRLTPGETVLSIQMVMLLAACTLLVCVLILLWMTDPIYPWLLVVISPAFLLFPFLTFSGGFRKELLGLASIGVIAVGVRLGWRPVLFTGLLGFSAAVLAHESVLVATPTVLWLLLMARSQDTIGMESWKAALILVAAPAAYTMLAFTAGARSPDMSAEICSSLLNRGYASQVCSGSIDFLSESATEALARVMSLAPGSLVILGLGAASLAPLLFVGFIPAHWRLFSFQLLALVPLFLTGIDYGRWIFIGAGALSLAAFSVSQRLKPMGGPILWLVFGLLMLFWSVPNDPTQLFLNPMRLAWWSFLPL